LCFGVFLGSLSCVLIASVFDAVDEQLLSGLAYLNTQHHVIHRDIKPSNLLLNSRGEVRVSDLGLVGQLTNSMENAMSFVGTVLYMSVRGSLSFSLPPSSLSLSLSPHTHTLSLSPFRFLFLFVLSGFLAFPFLCYSISRLCV